MLSESGNAIVDMAEKIEKFSNNKNSILSRIFSLNLYSDRKLTDLINRSPIQFIAIVLSELAGWTNSTINKDILKVNAEINSRFALLNNEISDLVEAIAYGRIEGEQIFTSFINILETVSRIETIPDNESKYIFQMQYELRKFTTDYFSDIIFELAKEILLRKVDSNMLFYVEAISRYVINPAYQIVMNLFSGQTTQQIIDNRDLLDSKTQGLLTEEFIQKYSALIRPYQIKFEEIIRRYFPNISSMEFERYRQGFFHECLVDVQTMAILFGTNNFRIVEDKIQFNDNVSIFKGHSYTGEKAQNEAFLMDSNEDAIFKNTYEVHTLRSYKDCHAYSHVRRFLNYLSEMLRVEKDEYGQVMKLFRIQEEH